MAFLIPCALVLLLGAPLRADLLTFDSEAGWETWQRPFGLTRTGAGGALELVRFRKQINAVADAHLFAHETRKRGDTVFGGVWEAGSNAADGRLAVDGDLQTFWKPSPHDARESWFLTIDLGRAVLATEIRLTFPDREGARPFRQFRVFATSGVRIDASDDVFLYRQIFRTTRPNAETQISIPLSFGGRDSALVVDADLELSPRERNQYRLIQYIQIIAEEQSADAALAEVEVVAVGDNIAIGTHQRGNFVEGDGTGSTANLFDANLNTNNTVTDCRPPLFRWDEGGTWFRVDLGAVFFLDEIFLYSMQPDEGTLGFTVSGTGPGHTLLLSDGRLLTGSQPPVKVPEAVDYEELLTHRAPNADRLLYIRYLFQPRRARYLFFHGVQCSGFGIAKWGELQLFSPGYPAQVNLRSDFIDLGREAGDGRPKVIKALHWDADLPPGTALKLRSRSGNELAERYTFRDRKGDVVTEEKWLSSPKVLRGEVDTTQVVGEDWDAWSNTYQFPGEPFQSASPRRFALLEMILSTESPDLAPVVNSLSIEFEEALLQEARGQVEPRRARPNEQTRFAYTLWPRASAGDSGFDRLRFIAPGPVDPEDVQVHIGGQVVERIAVELRGDSLLIDLPDPVLADSVRASFTTRLLENATVFALDLGLRERPGLWQSVEPSFRRANIVLLPELTASQGLIGDLQIRPAAFTPNGDGVNDELEVRFVAFKVEDAVPRAQVFDLAGRPVALLQNRSTGAQQLFVWDGRDTSGQRVRPGLYLLHLDLGAESGQDTALRSIAVAY